MIGGGRGDTLSAGRVGRGGGAIYPVPLDRFVSGPMCTRSDVHLMCQKSGPTCAWSNLFPSLKYTRSQYKCTRSAAGLYPVRVFPVISVPGHKCTRSAAGLYPVRVFPVISVPGHKCTRSAAGLYPVRVFPVTSVPDL